MRLGSEDVFRRGSDKAKTMAHAKTMNWEKKLNSLLREVDRALERRYGEDYPLHPARLSDGKAANPQYDGLFSVTAAFSAGFRSEYGPGYTIEVRMVTLSNVPEDARDKIEDEAAELIRAGLPAIFPGKEIALSREGSVYRIHGDLSL